MKEFRIFGPPGTGKTSRLVGQSIPAAIERFGPDRVMVTSFTRAAAVEIADRLVEKGSAIDQQNVGTLHAICYRALGRPELVGKHMREWNESNPLHAISGEVVSDVDEGGSEDVAAFGGSAEGDRLLARIQILRARMVPEQAWPDSCRAFYARWCEWKRECHYVDFTDLIEMALAEMPFAPGGAQVMIVDEAQDNTPLMLALCRSWGVHMPWFVLCGDDDQTLYQFSGATPDAFLDPPVDAKYKTVLSQSYRVPRAVHRCAEAMIRRVGRREPKDYAPKDCDGQVSDLSAVSYRRPDDLLGILLSAIERDETTMILASCAYMLTGVIKLLRGAGVPFFNPYKRTRGDWNPLKEPGKGISTSGALRAFLGDYAKPWTIPELLSWVKLLKVGDEAIRPRIGNKSIAALEQAVKDEAPGLESCEEVLGMVLGDQALGPAQRRDVDWFVSQLKPARQAAAPFPVAVYRRLGAEALSVPPKVVVGTIHSVKGGEADNVILFPDLSYAAAEQADTNTEARDAHARMFYVGMTRAKRNLFLCRTAQNIWRPQPLRQYVEW